MAELRDAIGTNVGVGSALRSARPASPLEELRTEVEAHGHPDFR